MRHSQQGFIDAVQSAYYKLDDAATPEQFRKICNDILKKARLHKSELYTVTSKLLCDAYEKRYDAREDYPCTQSRLFHDANTNAHFKFINEYRYA